MEEFDRFVAAPNPDASADYAFVSYIELSTFYTGNARQFDKNSLWQSIEHQFGDNALTQPDNIDGSWILEDLVTALTPLLTAD